MKVKLFSAILLFFIILSNISFSLTSIYSFLNEKDNLSAYNTINIQEQYNMLVNMPKNLVNICVRVSYDIKTFANVNDKKQNIVSNNYKYDQSPIALIYSTTKAKIIKNISEYKNLLFTLTNFSVKMFIIPIIIFYLLCYIGLLRLFGSISLLSLQINCMGNSVYAV